MTRTRSGRDGRARQTPPTRSWLASIAASASSLRERLNGEGNPVAAADEVLVDARLQRWCEVVAPADPAALGRRLAWDGLDVSPARRALGSVGWPPGRPLPNWTELSLASVTATANQAAAVRGGSGASPPSVERAALALGNRRTARRSGAAASVRAAAPADHGCRPPRPAGTGGDGGDTVGPRDVAGPRTISLHQPRAASAGHARRGDRAGAVCEFARAVLLGAIPCRLGWVAWAVSYVSTGDSFSASSAAASAARSEPTDGSSELEPGRVIPRLTRPVVPTRGLRHAEPTAWPHCGRAPEGRF